MRYHLTDDGPKPCKAVVLECPLGGEHYDDAMVAQSAYETRLETALGAFRGTMDLQCAFGTMKVVDGDLSNFEARNALISGLCGDLALAVQRKTGGDAYLVTYGELTPEQLEEEWRAGRLIEAATHAVVESKTTPGQFMDSYGRKTEADLKDFYGDDYSVVKVTPAMLETYSSGISETLNNFAQAVIDLDASGESYDYSVWES